MHYLGLLDFGRLQEIVRVVPENGGDREDVMSLPGDMLRISQNLYGKGHRDMGKF